MTMHWNIRHQIDAGCSLRQACGTGFVAAVLLAGILAVPASVEGQEGPVDESQESQLVEVDRELMKRHPSPAPDPFQMPVQPDSRTVPNPPVDSPREYLLPRRTQIEEEAPPAPTIVTVAGELAPQRPSPRLRETSEELAERVRLLEATVLSLQQQQQQLASPAAALPQPALPAPEWPEPAFPAGQPAPGDAQMTTLSALCETCASDEKTDALCSGKPGDSWPTAKLGGFIQFDAAWFSQDAGNKQSVGDFEDGIGFRRARLNASGELWENVSYLLDVDFGLPAHPGFADVIATLHEVPAVGNVRVGFWRQPFGMDALTSATNLTFIERSLLFAFVPFRQSGIGFYDHAEDESMTWAASAFRSITDAWGGLISDSGGYGFAGRFTWLPMDRANGKKLVHLGASYSYFDPANNAVRYAAPPEVFLFADVPGPFPDQNRATSLPLMVDTGLISARQVNLVGLEAAGVWETAHWQAEFMLASVNRAGGDSVTFEGGSVQAGLVLTGESRGYDRAAGVLGRVVPTNPFKPGSGWGAWELAGRWSYLNLNSGSVQGGRLHDLTAGLNWYLNGHTKVQFNRVQALLDNPTFGGSSAAVYSIRTQVDF